MFILTVLHSTPSNRLSGFAPKGLRSTRNPPFHYFSMENERNVPNIVFVNLAFITSPCVFICSFSASFLSSSVHPSAQLLFSVNPVKCRPSNVLIWCFGKCFNFLKDGMFLTQRETFESTWLCFCLL